MSQVPSRPTAVFQPPYQTWGRQRERNSKHWQCRLDRPTLDLARTSQCFNKIESDGRLGYDLPPSKSTAGQVLLHAKNVIRRTLREKEPMTFKVGWTHCPVSRFYNKVYGYMFDRDRWEQLTVLYAASEPHSAAFLEAALIALFEGDLSCTGRHIEPCNAPDGQC